MPTDESMRRDMDAALAMLERRYGVSRIDLLRRAAENLAWSRAQPFSIRIPKHPYGEAGR